MPKPPSSERRKESPWIIVEVPMQDADTMYPAMRRFYCSLPNTRSTENIDQAHQFPSQREAQKKANRLMHQSRNVWAEPVPFPVAWALIHSSGAEWPMRLRRVA